jgi:hypothetical protein
VGRVDLGLVGQQVGEPAATSRSAIALERLPVAQMTWTRAERSISPRREASCPIGMRTAPGTWAWANSAFSRTSMVTPASRSAA